MQILYRVVFDTPYSAASVALPLGLVEAKSSRSIAISLGVNFGLRPRLTPEILAFSSPSRTRSFINSRSNSPMAQST